MVKIKVLKKKLDPILKKMVSIIPNTTRLIPPSNSFFQAKTMSAKNPIQGSVLGLFFSNPIIPPPKDSDPEISAKVKTIAPIIKSEYLAIFLAALAALILFFFSMLLIIR